MNRRLKHIGAVLLVMALVVTACGGSDDDKESGGDSSDASDSSASDADPNGIIKVGYDLQQEALEFTFDPANTLSNGTANDALYNLLFGRLLQPNQDGSLTPDLAESAEITDTKTIKVVLRDDVVFSDGTPLTSESVKASFERNLANRAKNETGFLPAYYSLESVEIDSPTELRLIIPDDTAASWFDQHIATWKASVYKPGEPFEAIGAGPFKVESLTPGEEIVLVKNDTYWNADAVKVAGMEFQQVAFAQPQAGVAALRSGQFDATTTDPSQLDALSGNVEVVTRVAPDQTAMAMMCKADGPLADANVRRALNKGIDRDAINEAVYGGTAESMTQMWPTGHKFNNPDVDKDLAYDPEGARELIEEAGYDDGVTIDLYPLDFGGLSETAEVMKQQLAEVGITVNLVTGVNWVTDYLEAEKHAAGLYPGNAPGTQKLTAYTGTSLGNICDYDDPEFTELFNQISTLSENDPEAVDLWHEAAKIVVEDALSIFVLFRATLGAYDTERLGDMTPMVLGQYIVPDPFKTYVKKS